MSFVLMAIVNAHIRQQFVLHVLQILDFLLSVIFRLNSLEISNMPLLRSAKRRLDTQRAIINHFSQLLPSFNDLFDERAWYIFFTFLTLCSFLLAFLISRFIKIEDADYDSKNRKRTNRFAGVRRTRLS